VKINPEVSPQKVAKIFGLFLQKPNNKLPKVINDPTGENSPNLVTLCQEGFYALL
jgi:hypothetical protein